MDVRLFVDVACNEFSVLYEKQDMDIQQNYSSVSACYQFKEGLISRRWFQYSYLSHLVSGEGLC